MAIDTEAKRAASIHYGRPGTGGSTVPTASSTAFKRGTTLGLYPIVVPAASKTYSLFNPTIFRSAR